MKRALTTIFFATVLTGLLGGCASPWRVDSEVTSFARWTPTPPAPGSSYRFERLLSQQPDARQSRLEGLAQAALARVGLQFNPQAASFSVQIAAGTQTIYRSGWGYDNSPYGNIFIGGGSGGVGAIGFGLGFPLGSMEPPLYLREVSIVMRELRGNTVVYETRAVGDSPWQDSDAVLAAMFDAALRGFPLPPAGPRRISMEITR
jgi:hypothetical protein